MLHGLNLDVHIVIHLIKHCDLCNHRQDLHVMENGTRCCIGESFECSCQTQYFKD